MWSSQGNPEVWRKRRLMTLHVPAYPGAPASDFDIDIPSWWDDFWSIIDSAGEEVRIVQADDSLAVYMLDDGSGGTFDGTSRHGRIRLDGAKIPAGVSNCAVAIWVYYDSVTPQGDLSDPLATYSGTLTGYIELGGPAENKFPIQAGIVNQTKPRYSITKRVDEYKHVWFNLYPAMGRSVEPIMGATFHEEPWYATYDILDSTAISQGPMLDTTYLRWVNTEKEVWLRCPVQDGSDANVYTMVADLRTRAPDLTAGGLTQDKVHQRLHGVVGITVSDTLLT